MNELREAIRREGKGIGQHIVKVDMFLNHRLDTRLMFDMGRDLADHFRKEVPDIVLTVEASGIAIALATAHKLGDIPVVFAKKSQTSNLGEDMLTAMAHSFTHGNDNCLRVDRHYLPRGSRVLIAVEFDDQYQAGLDDRMKEMITEAVREVDENITDVEITNDDTLYGQVKGLGERLAKATGMDELADDFGDLWDRITGM